MAESSAERPRRLPPERRRVDLLNRAAAAFSADGFSLTTRDIAARCGVTQALLYRYFESKEALVEAVLRDRFLVERQGPDPELLDGDAPIEERLAAFYSDFVASSQRETLRLFIRAALDNLNLPGRYASRLDERMLRPVLDTLRSEAGIRASPPGRLPTAEREVAMTLHSVAVFTLIRRDVYNITLPLPMAEHLLLQYRITVPGALEEIRRLTGSRTG